MSENLNSVRDLVHRAMQTARSYRSQTDENVRGGTMRNTQGIADECRRALSSSAPVCSADDTALLCAAFAEISLRIPFAPEAERIDAIIEVCSPWSQRWNEAALPSASAHAHALLGEAYFSRMNSDRPRDASSAIRHLESALALFPSDTDSAILGGIHHNLGAMYTEVGDFQRGIEECEVAAALFPREYDLVRWAVIRSDLGLAYLSGGDEAVESGISRILDALEVLTRSRQRRLWAHAQDRLGLGFLHRASGDKRQNVESAIECFHKALDVFSTEESRPQRVMVLRKMGWAYYSRIEGCRTENLSRAIECLEEGVLLARQLSALSEWPDIQYLLARSYFARRRGDDDLRRAASCYRSSLDSLDPVRGKISRKTAARELAEVERILRGGS